MAVKLSIQLMMLVMLLFRKQAFATNTKTSVAKPGCQDSCGNLKISYPFGIGENCSASKAMAMYCNNSFKPAKAFLRDKDSNNLEVLNISLEAGTISISYPITTDCTKTSNDLAHHQVRLALPLTFSNNDNRFTAMGCDNLALLSSTSEDSSQLEAGGCLSKCNPSIKKDNSCFGINCCQTKFPQSLTFVRPSFSNGSIPSSGCSEGPRYAFIVDQKWFAKLNDIYIVQTMETVPAVLNWKPFGACQTFIELDPNKNGTLCRDNAFCTNQSLCSCIEGYEGNPYLWNGCQDINECASPQSKALPGCDHKCINTLGSYNCSCKDGWVLVDKFKCLKYDRKGKKGAIIATAVTCAGVGVTLIVTWHLYKETRRRYVCKLGVQLFKRNGGLLLQQLLSSGQENEKTTKLFTSKELETATDHYNEDRIVGQGGNRTVYKGMLTDGRIVAVKKTKIEDKSKIKQFINEVVTLSRINHRNIVKLYGCCLETEVPLLVYEFIPNGTLMQYIHEENECFPLTWDVRLRVATEVAGALCYLHSASIPIYHRNIKSTNILLDDKYRAKLANFGISAAVSIDQKVADFGASTSFSTDQKVADFGSSTSFSTDKKLADLGTSTSFSTDQKVVDFGTSTSFSNDQTRPTTRLQGTFGYLDPEYFQSRQFTDKSDVYSFGVVLVELLTGQKPILATTLDDEARGLATSFKLAMEENRIFDIVDSRIISEEKKEEMIAFADIAYRCLNLNGRKRPTMKQVAAELESIRNTPESPTAQEIYEEDENEKHELNATWEAEVTSSSLDSIINSVTNNISNF